MDSKNYTYIEKQLKDVLTKIWENKNSIDQIDVETLTFFANKGIDYLEQEDEILIK